MKNLLFNIAGLVFIAVLSSCQLELKEVKRPNILFAIADDASWKHFSAYGCKWIKTPAFDKVADQGILFTNAYTPNAKCAPSRSCILTGRNSWQLEEACNHAPYFPAKFKTYAEALGENGYWVGSVAKGWAPGVPGSINGKERELTGPKFDIHKTTPPTEYISDNDYARNFEEFLKVRPKDKPFCFWFGSKEPHRAYEFKAGIKKGGKKLAEINKVPEFWPDVDSIRTDMLDYAFEIEYFDSHLQKMLNKLEEIGELDNTIVVVTADNGMPFPRIKGQVYEYSNHLPLAIMWPKGIKKPGRVVDDFVNFIDFAPTFLDVADLTFKSAGMQATTGKSLNDIFSSEKSGKVTADRDFILVGKERHDVGRPDDQGYPVRGIVKGDFLYLRNFKPARWPQGNPETGYLNCDASPTKTYILDTRRKKDELKYWQLNFGKRVAEELYNIKKDPYCMNNLAKVKDFFVMKSRMLNEMKRRLMEQKDPRILGNGDIFDQYQYSGSAKDYYNRYIRGEKVKAGWINESDYDTDFKE
nr:sulfatase [uncultured Marinifilum sp.]